MVPDIIQKVGSLPVRTIGIIGVVVFLIILSIFMGSTISSMASEDEGGLWTYRSTYGPSGVGQTTHINFGETGSFTIDVPVYNMTQLSLTVRIIEEETGSIYWGDMADVTLSGPEGQSGTMEVYTARNSGKGTFHFRPNSVPEDHEVDGDFEPNSTRAEGGMGTWTFTATVTETDLMPGYPDDRTKFATSYSTYVFVGEFED